MTVNISYFAGAGWQFFDDNGNPLSGGLIYTYDAGTTTPVATYTNSTGLIQNSNPIVLDASGRTPQQIWLTTGTTVKFVLKDSTGSTIGTYDNISGINDFSAEMADLANATNIAKGDALIGYKQANASGFLSGAQPRTVHSKLTEMVSVYDFMTLAQIAAVQAGTSTDDTVALQAAIDSGAKTIWIPKGLYKTTDQLLIFNKFGVTLLGEYGTNIRYVGSQVANRAILKLQTSSYCNIERIRFDSWAGGPDTIAEIPNSKADFGIYITSEGNNPITQYNTIKQCTVEWVRGYGIQIGNLQDVDVDVNIDGNSVLDSFVAWCFVAIRVFQANTNMTRLIGGAIANVSNSGIVIGRNARGVTIDNILAFNTAQGFIVVKKENSGPIWITNIVQELYQGPFLVVEPVSGGLANKNIITMININCTNNDPTVGNPVINYQGAGSVIMQNCRFGGFASGRGGVGAKLTFRPANGAIGGTQWLKTENVELYDGATWDVETDQGIAWIRWLDIGSTIRSGNAGEGSLSTPLIRERGRIQHEIQTLTSITLPTGVTQDSYGYLGNQVWKVTIDKAAWTSAATSQSLVIATLPAKTRIVGAYADITTAYAGLAGTIQLSVSTTGAVDLLSPADVKTAAVTLGLTAGQLGAGLSTNFVQNVYVANWAGATQIQVTLASGTGNIGTGTATNLTNGVVTVYLITETLPSY